MSGRARVDPEQPLELASSQRPLFNMKAPFALPTPPRTNQRPIAYLTGKSVVSNTHPVVLVRGASYDDNARVMKRVLDTHAMSLAMVV